MITLRSIHHRIPTLTLTHAQRRAAASVALIAGLTAGPIAGVSVAAAASPSTPATPAANAAAHTPAVPAAAAAAAKAPAAKAPAPAAPAAPAAKAPAPAAPAPAAPAPAPVAPSTGQLMPEGVPGADTQSTIDLSAEQVDNARTITQAAQDLHLPARAAVIAVATSMQETKLHNYGDLGGSNDHDSLGLFQQRPSSGWGTPAQVTDPRYAATAFLNSLVQVPGWDTMPLTDAAQAVQVSAFGDRYAQWEHQAADLVLSNYHTGPYANAG